MDIDYNSVINFRGLKGQIESCGYKIKYIAERTGIDQSILSRIMKNDYFPKTDLVSKIAFVLNIPVSKVVVFNLDSDEKKKEWFASRELPYTPPSEPEGVLTYEPFRLMTSMYLDYYNSLSENEKTLNDLLDKIEPYRRRNGLVTPVQPDFVKASLVARGYDENYKSKRERHYERKGLTPEMRLKLRKDRPLNIRSVYDICNFFGCSIDWVVSYK